MSEVLTLMSSGPEATIASSSAPLTEEVLVAATNNGDEQAFETLVKRHQKRILAIAVRYTRARPDAEDVSQQTFQRAFVNLHKSEGKSSFSTWLTRIAINEALMFLCRGGAQRETTIDESCIDAEGVASRPGIPDADPQPELSYVQQEEARLLYSALEKLRPGLRRTIELWELAELSSEETARLSVGVVKARLFHGRRHLRKALTLYMRSPKIPEATFQ